MTQTHARRNHALLQQQKLIDHNVNTEKQQWNTTLLLTQQKMQSSIKQLQKERVMWQVLSQEAELRCEDEKSNGRTLVQMQVDKAIRKERELQSYMLELQEIRKGDYQVDSILSQEAELRCEDEKSNGRTLVQMQVDKAIRKERELQSYMLELQEIHAVKLLRERKAKCVEIQSSKHW